MARSTRYDDRPRVGGGDGWGQYPLAPSPSRPAPAPPSAAPAPQGAAQRRRAVAPAPARAAAPAASPALPEAAPENPLPFDPGTIVISLPIAISLGMLDWQAAAGWGAVLIVYKGLMRPGVLRGTLDFLVDGLDIGGAPRRMLGVPEQLPRPSGGMAESLWEVPGAIIGDWKAAIAARSGQLVEGVQGAVEAVWQRRPDVVGDDNRDGAAEGRTMRLRPEQARGAAERLAAIDAQVDRPPAAIPGLAQVRLSDIADLDNIWVVGPKNSGKTTVLRKLVAMRHGAHVALDPHNTPGKWPRCAVVGGGRNYAAIGGTLAKAITKMDARYKAMDAGEVTEEQCKAARQTLVGDEWLSISDQLPGAPARRGEEAEPAAADQLLTILTEGRKAGMTIMAASHADTATAMGLAGKKDVLRCFDVIIYLGGMATKYRPEAAAMERPALLYDPEHDVWAQLHIDGPAVGQVPPAAEAPAAADLDLEEPVAAPPPAPVQVTHPAGVEAPVEQHAREGAPPAPRRGATLTPEELTRVAPRLAAARSARAQAAPTPAPADLAAMLAEPVPEPAGPPPAPAQQSVTIDEGPRQVVVNVSQVAPSAARSARRPTPARGSRVKPAGVGRQRIARAAPESDAERVAAWLRANPEWLLRTDAGMQLRRGAKTRIAELLGVAYSGTSNSERIDKAAGEGLQLVSS